MRARAVSVTLVVLGSGLLLVSPAFTWAAEGNLSSMTLLRAIDLAASDVVDAAFPVRALLVVFVAVLGLVAASAGFGPRWVGGLRFVVAVVVAVGVAVLATHEMFGSGVGIGLAVASTGCVALAVGSVLGITMPVGAHPVLRWSPPVVTVAALGVLIGAMVLSAGLGADDGDEARDGLVAAIEAGDVVAAATYLSPDELVRYGGVALGADALAERLGFDPLSGQEAPGRVVSTVLGVGVRLLSTVQVDGRTYVLIEPR